MQGRSWICIEVLVEATEVNEMIQTESVERREKDQDRTEREGAYLHNMKEDISVILHSLMREMRKLRNWKILC